MAGMGRCVRCEEERRLVNSSNGKFDGKRCLEVYESTRQRDSVPCKYLQIELGLAVVTVGSTCVVR